MIMEKDKKFIEKIQECGDSGNIIIQMVDQGNHTMVKAMLELNAKFA